MSIESIAPGRIRMYIVLVGLILFVPFLGSVHLFDWDEINFAECAREMIRSGDYIHVQIDYTTFAEKPPLFIWVQAASMHMFGVNEFAARLPNALIGILTLLVVFEIGRKYHTTTFGVVWVLAYAGSFLPHFYARSGIIDPLFNLLIFAAILCSRSRWWLGGILAGLAVLTKGPVGWGMVMMVLGVLWLVERKERSLPWKEMIGITLLTIAVNSTWYAFDLVQNGWATVQDNLAYQFRLLTTGEAGHAQPFWYHFVVVLIGCFPASILAVSGHKLIPNEQASVRYLHRVMIVLLWCTLIVFSIVKTKIVHYSSLTYLPLTYLAAASAYAWCTGALRWRRWWTISLISMLVVWTALGFAVPWAFMNSSFMLSLPSFKDAFLRSSLMQHVDWLGIEPYVVLVLPLCALVAWQLAKRNKFAALVASSAGVCTYIALFLPLVAPKIERYTQGAAIDFYTSLKGKDVYVKPLTYKSYAHLFYTDKPPYLSAAYKGIAPDDFEPWLLEDKTDRPAYFVSRINDAERWSAHPNLLEIGRRGGFVFYRRIPNSYQSPQLP